MSKRKLCHPVESFFTALIFNIMISHNNPNTKVEPWGYWDIIVVNSSLMMGPAPLKYLFDIAKEKIVQV